MPTLANQLVLFFVQRLRDNDTHQYIEAAMRFLPLLLSFFLTILASACGGGGGSAGTSLTNKPVALFTTAPGAVSIGVGVTNNFVISGGVPPYRSTSSNVRVLTTSATGSVFSMTGLDAGSASVVVSDSAGATLSVSTTVLGAGALFTSAPPSITVTSGQATSFAISGGVPPYLVSTSNAMVATGQVSGSFVSIVGVGSGTGSILVNDSKNSGAITIAVTVPALNALSTTAPSAIVVSPGQSSSFVVMGGAPPYAVASNNTTVASGNISGTGLTVSGTAAGAASIVISDSKGALITIAVAVGSASNFTVNAPPALAMDISASSTYSISGGATPYAVSSSDSRVVVGAISGNTLTVNSLAGGSASLLVTDALGKVFTVAVSVGSASPFTVNAPASLVMGVGVSSSYQISGGASPYTVSTSDSRVATGTISGNVLTINPLKGGTVSVLAKDALGKSFTISVTVDTLSSANAVAFIEILPSGSSLSSAAASVMNFLVTVKDQANTTVPNQTVTFTASSGNLIGANPSPLTGVNGSIASVALSPGVDATNRNITITAAAGAATKSIVIPVVGTTVSISGPGSTLVGATALSYSLKAADSGGKPISGAVLTISSTLGNTLSSRSVITDSAGAATVNYTATQAGTDTLKVVGLGTSSQTAISVSNEDFSFASPIPSSNLVVSTPNSVTVRYLIAGVGQAGRPVTFSSTRGTISSSTVLTDLNGYATAIISSSTSGPATVSAQLSTATGITARATLAVAFVSVTPATIFLQANPNAVLPNTTGGSTNQSSLLATVRDSVGNPVAGQVVNFTALSDGSNGYITPGSVTTDSSGLATVQFVSGAISTPANGVILQASVQNTTVSATTSLTVNGSSLFISIGMSNDLIVVDSNTYAKSFSVYVTDANGAPAGSKAVTLSVYPTTYLKGRLFFNNALTPPQWDFNGAVTSCGNEDSNRNGILDTGEDFNGDGRLTPGLPVVLSPATLTTDANGYASFVLNYGKNYALWLNAQITAKASVTGTESSKLINYYLAMLATDATALSTPANAVSPFGAATLCTDPN